MNDKAKIAALRAALIDERTWLEDQRKSISKGCGSSWDMLQCTERINLINDALTADDAEQAPGSPPLISPLMDTYNSMHIAVAMVKEAYAKNQAKRAATTAPIAEEPAPKPWQDRMAEHFGQGKSVQCHPASHFMQQEIEEWRKSGAVDARDASQWRDLLEAVIREIPHRHPSKNGDAPGHSHSVPGVWNSDNGAKAEMKCAWCLVWEEASKAISAMHPTTGGE